MKVVAPLDFQAALVAGVTVYAYLCHLPLVTHGLAWVQHGGGEVRFKQPVFDLDYVAVRGAHVRSRNAR